MPDRRWRVPAELASVDSPDRVAMIRPDRPLQAPVILEDSGAVIWAAMSGPKGPVTAAELAGTLDFPVVTVEAFLVGLQEFGLVEEC